MGFTCKMRCISHLSLCCAVLSSSLIQTLVFFTSCIQLWISYLSNTIFNLFSCMWNDILCSIRISEKCCKYGLSLSSKIYLPVKRRQRQTLVFECVYERNFLSSASPRCIVFNAKIQLCIAVAATFALLQKFFELFSLIAWHGLPQ
jgi:hypothetical protein